MIPSPKPVAETAKIIADSERINGTKSTNKGLSIAIGLGVGSFLLTFCGVYVYKHLNFNFFKKKEEVKTKEKITVDDNKSQRKREENTERHEMEIAKEKLKHEQRLAEQQQKFENRKELIELRQNSSRPSSSLTENAEIDGLAPTYDEVISGKDVDVSGLRVGLRCFHIGEDCGGMGAQNTGKSSFFFCLALALAGQSDAIRLFGEAWNPRKPMKVLYFAFEHRREHFQAKYKKYIKRVPNLSLVVDVLPHDFDRIKALIENQQKQAGEQELVVFFDNITKMQTTDKTTYNFFDWLEKYRIHCASEGHPITYIKIYHTHGKYKHNMAIDANSNYGFKTNTMFTQDLVAFGICKGDRKTRYLKELKNKLEPDAEKETVSVFRFAHTPEEIEAGKGAPLYEYVGEAPEHEVLPSPTQKQIKDNVEISAPQIRTPKKRGPKERFTPAELQEMYDEHEAGFSYREILGTRGYPYDDNKSKGIRKAFKKHKIGKYKDGVMS